jgi:hypothetical protein
MDKMVKCAAQDSVVAQRHAQLAAYFSGRWAGEKKPYTAWLSAVVQVLAAAI